MTKTTDPIQYANYLRTGNVIEIGDNRYEVKSTHFIPSDEQAAPLLQIYLEAISHITPHGAQRPTLPQATLIVDPKTIIPVIE